MKIGDRYISRNSVIGYHWFTTSYLSRRYFCIDLINGEQIDILTHLGSGEEVQDVSNIIKWIEGEDEEEYKEEIERLNKELQDTKEHLGEYLHEQEEENKRLNNIIDFIVESIEDMWVDGFEADNWQYDRKVLNRKEFLDKIKELRGDSKC